MAGERVTGFTEASAFFEAIPEAARQELHTLLLDVIVDANQIQDSKVPRRTGNLAENITIQDQIQQLRVRSGIFMNGRGKSAGFYGWIIEGGRRAQTVVVRRRRRGVKGRRTARNIAASYVLRVSPLAPHVFIHVEDQLAPDLDRRLSDFWDRVLGRAGGNGR